MNVYGWARKALSQKGSSLLKPFRLVKYTFNQCEKYLFFFAVYEYHKLYRNENGAILFARNEDKVRKEESRCGYLSSVSFKNDLDAIGTLRAYKLRNEQEKYFDHMKDQMGSHTQQNSSETGNAGMLFILFVELILTSHARNVWRSTNMKKKYDISLDMVDELEPIWFSEYTR